MVKDAWLLSEHRDLFEVVRAVLGQSSYALRGGTDFAQAVDSEGRLLTIDRTVEHDFEALPLTAVAASPDVAGPDWPNVTICLITCRSESWVAWLAREVALACPKPVWIYDSATVLWDAAHVDSGRLVL